MSDSLSDTLVHVHVCHLSIIKEPYINKGQLDGVKMFERRMQLWVTISLHHKNVLSIASDKSNWQF